MRQFLRKARVTFGGPGGGFVVNPGRVQTHELTVAFSVSKSISGSANTASIRVWNLSEAHRNGVGKEFSEITLECGYMPPEGGGNVGVIFAGQVRDVRHTREGPDIVTEVSCGDGDTAFRKATISKTYPAGTRVEDVVDGLHEELAKHGVKKGEFKFPKDMPAFKRPYSMCGGCRRELDTIGRGKGFYWSVQNGVMEVIPGDGFLPGVVVLSPETGLIGTPTITDNGIQFKALLNPAVRPNRTVEIKSKTLEMGGVGGLLRVSQATYAGDNRSGDFSVSGHGENISGGTVDEGVR